MQSTTLYYREGSSDKVYTATIQAEGSGYHVAFAYGRRNSTLQTGLKTTTPVPLEEAQRIFDKLIRDKKAKGYTEGAGTAAYAGAGHPRQSTGILPQLLKTVSDDQVDRLLEDPAYWLQEKLDGRRLLLRKEGTKVTAINRLGLETSLPQPVMDAALRIPLDFILDGEAMGESLWIFDVLEMDSEDWRSLPFGRRLLKVIQIFADYKAPHLSFVPTAFLPAQKRRVYEDLKAQGREGVVFKHVDGLYTPGPSRVDASQLKFKFYETASFIVNKINAARSVSLMLFQGDKIKLAGNVTIPPNHEIPQPGQVVECRYLYAFRESGSIYQPVYLGSRGDVRASECVTSQLKYKPQDEDIEAVGAAVFC